MESGDRILVAASLTAAVVVGAFVWWGPGGAPRTRKRRGQIAGLDNLDRTCFLNTLLQALAACPAFVCWLQKYCKNGSNNSMITTLSTVLEVVNGTHESARGASVCPLGVLNCLKALGWVVPADQHDAHELLHVLLSCVEEEIQAIVKRPGCLSDALGLWVRPRAVSAITSPASPPTRPGPPSLPSAPPGLLRIARLRAASSPATPDTMLHNYTVTSTILTDAIEKATTDEPEFIDDAVNDSPNRAPSASALQRGVSRSFCHLNVVGRGLSSGRTGGLRPCIPTLPPFNGTMATRLQCTVCSSKTPVRYDKFDSISLPLVSSAALGDGTLSLAALLRAFTAPEILRGVACAHCDAGRPEGLPPDTLNAHIKTVSFGKLPMCLCLHLSRTQWTPNGLTKRNDHVAFPETLSLAPFTSSQPPKVDLPSLTSLMSQNSNATLDLSNTALVSNGAGDSRSAYRLQAVVVHVGGPRSGHFITYRRGNGFEAKRWFYTSDTVIIEVSLDEVLHCCAYMLFYERMLSSSQSQMKYSLI